METFLAAGLIRMLDPLSEPVLERIRQCAMDSKRMKLTHANLLIDQGLVD
jgi:hypothetical protein